MSLCYTVGDLQQRLMLPLYYECVFTLVQMFVYVK